MNKILSVSIAAMLAVTPMLAQAAGSNPTAAGTSSEPYLGVEVATADANHIASTAYVKGAYNAAIGAVNAVSASKQDTLTSSNAGNGIAISNGVISASNITTSQISGSTLATTIGPADGTGAATDTQIPTAAAVRAAISSAGGQTASQVEDKIDAAAGAGLATNGSGVLSVNGGDGITVDTTNDVVKVNADTGTFEFDSTSHALKIKTKGIATAQINDKAVTTAKIADGAVTSTQLGSNAVTDGKIASGAVSVSNIKTTELAQTSDATLAAAEGATKLVQKGYVDEAIATAAAGKVTASSTTTFTNKTFDANATGNSISNLETADFASGVVVTSVGATGSDSSLPTEKAVRSAIGSVETKLGSGASGYSINANALQIKGVDVPTKTQVNTAISNTTASTSFKLYKSWGNDNEDTGTVTITPTISLTPGSIS